MAAILLKKTQDLDKRFYDALRLYFEKGVIPVVGYQPNQFLQDAKSFRLKNGKLYYKSKLVIENVADQEKCVAECHIVNGKHKSQHETLRKVENKYFWGGISYDVEKCINLCKICNPITDQIIKFQLWKFVEIGLIADDILVANDLQNSSIFKCVKLESNEPDAVCNKLYQMMCFYGIPDGFKLIKSNCIDEKFAEEFEISLNKTIKDMNKTVISIKKFIKSNNFIADISKYSIKSHFKQEKPPKNFDELVQFDLAFVALNEELSEMKLVHLFMSNEWTINEEGINLLFTIADKFSQNDDLENILNSLHLFAKMEKYKVKPAKASNKNDKPRESALQKELRRLNETTPPRRSSKNFKIKIQMKKYENEQESSESSYSDDSSESEDEKNKKPNKSSSTINKKVPNGIIKEKKKTEITIGSPISSQSSSSTSKQENISKPSETISKRNSNKTNEDGRSSRLSLDSKDSISEFINLEESSRESHGQAPIDDAFIEFDDMSPLEIQLEEQSTQEKSQEVLSQKNSSQKNSSQESIEEEYNSLIEQNNIGLSEVRIKILSDDYINKLLEGQIEYKRDRRPTVRFDGSNELQENKSQQDKSASKKRKTHTPKSTPKRQKNESTPKHTVFTKSPHPKVLGSSKNKIKPKRNSFLSNSESSDEDEIPISKAETKEKEKNEQKSTPRRKEKSDQESTPKRKGKNSVLIEIPTQMFDCPNAGCGFKTNDQKNLILHTGTHKQKVSRQEFYCEDCCDRFTSQADLDWHKRAEHSLTRFQIKKTILYGCSNNDCMEAFETKSAIEEHFKKHIFTIDQTKLRCKNCNKIHGPEEILDHLNKEHRKFKCYACSVKVNSIDQIERHGKLHHYSGGMPFQCNFCDQTFFSFAGLANHRKNNHFVDWNEDSLTCIVCDKNITIEEDDDSFNIIEHLILNHVEDEKYCPFQCKIDKEQFRTSEECFIHCTNEHGRIDYHDMINRRSDIFSLVKKSVGRNGGRNKPKESETQDATAALEGLLNGTNDDIAYDHNANIPKVITLSNNLLESAINETIYKDGYIDAPVISIPEDSLYMTAVQVNPSDDINHDQDNIDSDDVLKF